MIGSSNDRSQVAWDIETTGFDWDDQITVTGFWFPTSHAELILQAPSGELTATTAASQITEHTRGLDVSVKVVESESGLLTAMQEVVFERFDREYNRLIAFNAESWNGGFDLPFLRTRCLHHGIRWPFSGLQFADLWEPVKKRLNTTTTENEQSSDENSLTGAHNLLLTQAAHPQLRADGDTTERHPWYTEHDYDPFESSGEAVECYHQHEYVPILLHNLADIHRTWELGKAITEYVAARDLKSKKL